MNTCMRESRHEPGARAQSGAWDLSIEAAARRPCAVGDLKHTWQEQLRAQLARSKRASCR